MSSIQTFWLDGSFFLTFSYKIWGAQIAGMALPRVSQFFYACRKASKNHSIPLEKNKSHKCAPDLLLPVVALFSRSWEGADCKPEELPQTLLIFFPRAHIWQYAPHGMHNEPTRKRGVMILGFHYPNNSG